MLSARLSASPGGCGGSQPLGRSLRFPAWWAICPGSVRSVSSVSRWREDDNGDDAMRGTPGAVQQISWHLLYDWGKPQKTPIRKPSEALSRANSHCFKWGPFPPNEDCRATLPVPLAKPIRPRHKSVLKNLRIPRIPGVPLWATLKKFSSWGLILPSGNT